MLGQSWGGFLAQEYALTHPPGLRSLVIANSAASFPDFVAEANKLRAELPPDVEATLRRHEGAGTTDDPEYEAACEAFYVRHVCRLDPWPPEVVEAFAWIERDPTVYHTMNGPSEFHVVGSIKEWQSKDRLGEIDVPTLVVSGRYDEATPALRKRSSAGSAPANGYSSRTPRTFPTSRNGSGTWRSLARGSPATSEVTSSATKMIPTSV